LTEYDNTNRGVLFQNYKKESDKHPDYKGELNVDGVEFQIAGWKKTSKNGNTFLSISINKKGEYGEQSQERHDDGPAPF